jgi:hypothetical protein
MSTWSNRTCKIKILSQANTLLTSVYQEIRAFEDFRADHFQHSKCSMGYNSSSENHHWTSYCGRK